MTSGKNTRGSIPGRRKLKRTFSLSTESLAYLEAAAQKHRSVSEALEMIIRERRQQAEIERISAGIRRYYDTMSEEERAENDAWGEFVLANLAKD
ncbi:MAG TPA: hypothetical protein VF753_20090 [Terriglobales bacterium]